jgi:ABC-type lipoprotein release transport system permease subunit
VAAVGLYALLAFEVAQRTRELGIRSALGAEKRRLLMSVVLHGMRLTALGAGIGTFVGWLTAPRIEGLLFDVSPRDPAVFAAVAAVLVLVSLAAGLAPGLRATRVSPAEALRSE